MERREDAPAAVASGDVNGISISGELEGSDGNGVAQSSDGLRVVHELFGSVGKKAFTH